MPLRNVVENCQEATGCGNVFLELAAVMISAGKQVLLKFTLVMKRPRGTGCLLLVEGVTLHPGCVYALHESETKSHPVALAFPCTLWLGISQSKGCV